MSEKEQKISTRFRFNLFLFVILAILIMFWFQKHLYLYVTETAFIGGTLTLWGVWKLLQTWVKWGIDTSETSLVQKIFGKVATTELIVLGLILTCFLYFSTSSIYFVYEGARTGESEFKVEVTKNGNPYLEPISLESFKGVEGHPFFLRFRTDTLIFRITEPHGFVPVQKVFRSGTNIQLKVPLDFARKKFNIVRLLPGVTLLNFLPKMLDEPEKKYSLNIRHKNELFTINDLRVQTIYFGAENTDIKAIVEQEDKTKFRSLVKSYLIKNDVPEKERGDKITRWENQNYFLSTKEFTTGDEIEIEIRSNDSTIPVAKKTIVISEENVVSTIILERTL